MHDSLRERTASQAFTTFLGSQREVRLDGSHNLVRPVRLLKRRDIFVAQLQVHRPHRIVKVPGVGGSDNWGGHATSVLPCQSDLSHRHTKTIGHFADTLYNLQVVLLRLVLMVLSVSLRFVPLSQPRCVRCPPANGE